MIRTIACFALLCFAAVLLIPVAFGQGTDLGTLRGVVTDPTGSVVPNAAVSVTDIATGVAREGKTNGQGEYEISGLRPGTYKLTIKGAGFAPESARWRWESR